MKSNSFVTKEITMYAKSKLSSISLNILAPSLSIVSDTPRKAYYETG